MYSAVMCIQVGIIFWTGVFGHVGPILANDNFILFQFNSSPFQLQACLRSVAMGIGSHDASLLDWLVRLSSCAGYALAQGRILIVKCLRDS